ncbi:MAG: hypothetical protein SGJ27_30330 [Candidatus Melainabacteria bacterium]|nr:hypothetical protein [Candidatus Melainabacteria bacterium]
MPPGSIRGNFEKWFAVAVCVALVGAPQVASAQSLRKLVSKEKGANSLTEPRLILRTGIDLSETGLSPNSLQLAETIGITPVLRDIANLRKQVETSQGAQTIDRLSARQDLWDASLKGALIIQRANLEIDFALAEIDVEQEMYAELLATYLNDRDKSLARTNAAGFISNGALWAVCEALAIPTYKQPRYAIPSGITGILAGIVPSAASMYAMKQVSGKKRPSEVEPNMLAKVFDYPTEDNIEYPKTVWTFLNQPPAAESPGAPTRREQMIDSWISDANISAFTDRTSKVQLDILTASKSHKDGLSIDTLTARKVMLQKLSAEILKMKRMLLEISMALQGEKQFTVYDTKRPPRISGTNTDTPK